ncbi:MAG TPA: efflux RND transporter periplasmic adaptor subunit [Chthoniobacterales bacterium]|nr:efflux RND transporter periplasmic adaptor subunit [Chthoniobacterales bacterium]
MKQLHLARVLTVCASLLLLLLVSGCGKSASKKADENVDYYTCTMHPSVHAKDPGKCPICAMDLVPVLKRESAEATPAKQDMAGMPDMAPAEGTSAGAATTEFAVPVERQQQIGVTYASVERRPLQHTIRGVGTVEADATRRWSFVARVAGYVEKLFVTSPGEIVEKDVPLLSIYSPDLLTTERELVSVFKMRDAARSKETRDTAQRLIDAAKSRLELWNVTEDQIAELEKSRRPSEFLILRSPLRGVVEQVAAQQGGSVKPGDRLVDVADLSVVWVWPEFYENELRMLQQGQKLALTTASYPGETFEGRIAVINPFIDPTKRTAKVRIEITNPDFKLRPGMFMNAELEMAMGEGLTIPVSAVMPTGTRNIVFLDKGEGKLEPRVVELRAKYGDRYEVREGLREGERVVASANFLIDAEAKVQGALKAFDADGVGERENRRVGETEPQR